MTTNLILINIFALTGTIVGYMMQVFSDRIVLKKCTLKNQEEKSNFFNGLIRKKEIRIIISIINGIIWALMIAFEKNILLAVIVSIIISLAIMISIIDIRIRIIPNELVLSLMLIGIIYQLINFGVRSLLIAFACMVIIIGVFLILGAIMGFDKIGAGDVKLAGVMGLVLGYPSIFAGLLIMSIIIILYSFVGFALYKISLKSVFAYAPFMMFGMAITLGITVLNIVTFI